MRFLARAARVGEGDREAVEGASAAQTSIHTWHNQATFDRQNAARPQSRESALAYVAGDTLVRARALRRKLTGAETVLWSRLRHGVGAMQFRRQHPIGPYIADFACIRARLVIEVDGATHGSDEERTYDARREAYLRSRSWRIVRVTNAEVYTSLAAVLELIYHRSRTRV
jgi:very-short-patch-repair endonuclease